MSCVRASRNDHDRYDVVVVKDGAVARVTKDGVVRLVRVRMTCYYSWTNFVLKNICSINFRGFVDLQKFYITEKFPPG